MTRYLRGTAATRSLIGDKSADVCDIGAFFCHGEPARRPAEPGPGQLDAGTRSNLLGAAGSMLGRAAMSLAREGFSLRRAGLMLRRAAMSLAREGFSLRRAGSRLGRAAMSLGRAGSLLLSAAKSLSASGRISHTVPGTAWPICAKRCISPPKWRPGQSGAWHVPGTNPAPCLARTRHRAWHRRGSSTGPHAGGAARVSAGRAKTKGRRLARFSLFKTSPHGR